ncbi:MAG: T9SS type A sorting domain-containing protein [Bacteroidetes bacterium]|nr:T9SS type A sorting domain-containing protein [Bacteroidota bacterium]
MLQPVKFELNQNYPNPFNPVTIISYSIPVSSYVRLEVYSITGQRVKLLVDETQSAGLHNMKFDGSSLSSGVYIYRLTAGEFVVSKKMQLLK